MLLPLGAAASEHYSWLSTPSPQTEFTTSLSEALSLRLGVSQFDRGAAPASDLLHFDDRDPALSASALVDWEISPGGFRLTGGAVYGESFGAGLGYSSGWNDRAGGMYYSDAYGMDDRGLRPYLGLGWGMELADEGRFGMQFDLGVLFDEADTGAQASGTRLQQDESVFGEEFDGLRYTPTFSADIYFRF